MLRTLQCFSIPSIPFNIFQFFREEVAKRIAFLAQFGFALPRKRLLTAKRKFPKEKAKTALQKRRFAGDNGVLDRKRGILKGLG